MSGDLPVQVWEIISTIAILVGTTMCFWPLKHIHVPMFLIGFQVTSFLAINFAYAAAPQKSSSTTLLIVGAVVGLIGGSVSAIFLKAAKAVVGLGASAALGYFILNTGLANLFGANYAVYFALAVVTIICLLLSFKFFDVLLSVTGALLGGFVVAVGISHFTQGHWRIYKLLNHPEQVACNSESCGVLLLVWLLFSTAGLVFQFRKKFRKRGQKTQDPRNMNSPATDGNFV